MLFNLSPYFLEQGYLDVINIIDQLPNHPTKKYATRNVNEIDKVVVHHTASEAPLINQAAYHVNGRGWPRIGYSIVIVKDRIYQTNHFDTLSYHCSGQNTHGIGVCILADFSKRAITAIERNLLSAVITSLKMQFPNIKDAHPHNEFARTACPVIPISMVREEIFHMEQEIEMMNSPQKKEEIAFRIANQTLYLFNMSKGKGPTGEVVTDKQKAWAISELYKFEPEFRRLGWLK